ncbi:TetR family transcriptional regulator [Mycobacteroides abscessus subsp. abscessus]|uniref:TetR/AcrR family transcriptional regulator n=1 Tax=Mycobacteroides abscessus TaxID=36809 RepID=UPI000928A222|nr:TetR family transcriptional regulator [Mycobacteroides abscessus]SIK96562.1 TetR family transcriptional regulator [Mycobacteroides abscessus subsp. abscessus]SLE16319.1 TetR family transcriptional regulator [Mycobacteroides abscessus subsp. abscessus]
MTDASQPAASSQSKPVRTWRGEAPEDRVAQRRNALLDAGLTELTAKGAAAVSITSVCAAAKLTQRYFYESFAGKDEFLNAVLDTTVRQAHAVILGALDDAPTDSAPALIAHLVDAFTDYLADDRRRPNLMFLQTRSHLGLALRGNMLAKEFITPISLALHMPPFDERRSSNDDIDVEMTALAIFGAMSQLYAAWAAGALDVDARRLAAHVTSVIEHCLPSSSHNRH